MMGWMITKKESGVFAVVVIPIGILVVFVVLDSFCLFLVVILLKHYKFHQGLLLIEGLFLVVVAFQQEEQIRRILVSKNYCICFGIEAGVEYVLIYCGYSLNLTAHLHHIFLLLYFYFNNVNRLCRQRKKSHIWWFPTIPKSPNLDF